MPTIGEDAFLCRVAVEKFNEQFGANFDPADFDVFSIEPCYSNTHGYEFYSVRTDDNLRLRVYFNLTQSTDFSPYRLENSVNDSPDSLKDEVFVCIGTMDRSYRDNRIYLFDWIEMDLSTLDFLLQENGAPLLQENGGGIRIYNN